VGGDVIVELTGVDDAENCPAERRTGELPEVGKDTGGTTFTQRQVHGKSAARRHDEKTHLRVERVASSPDCYNTFDSNKGCLTCPVTAHQKDIRTKGLREYLTVQQLLTFGFQLSGLFYGDNSPKASKEEPFGVVGAGFYNAFCNPTASKH